MNAVHPQAQAMAKAWAAGRHYFRERPALTIAVAISAPVAMALFNIMLIYGTAMPGHPPRDWARNLVLMPPIVAVVLLQAGACSCGDCF